MKKTLLAAALVMVSGSALAVDGGHIDFNGLVQSGTCKVGWILQMLLITLRKLTRLRLVCCRKNL